MTEIADSPVPPTDRVRAWTGMPLLFTGLALLFIFHIAVGAKGLPIGTVFDALVSYNPAEFDHVIVRDLRLPRAVTAVVVGASLSVAGALMQGMTRNPLADPGLLGLTAGASFAVVVSSAWFGLSGTMWIPWVASGGALAAAFIVYLIARWVPGGATPLSLTLAGAAISAFLAACVSMAHLLSEDTFENLRVWLTGSLAGRDIGVLAVTGPWLATAMLLALALARQVTVLAMGDEVARGLGVRAGFLKIQLLLAVVVLTACSVALAGPLGFIGLVIPHVVRLYVGADYRWIVPYSALAGAAYLVAIDVVARIAIAPQDVSTGIITAMLGAPLFVHLVRRRAR